MQQKQRSQDPVSAFFIHFYTRKGELLCQKTSFRKLFLLAFHELVIMGPIAFGIINPAEAKQYEIILAISSVTVCLMCPTMSLAATLLFSHPGSEVIAVWFQKTALNFPMAFFWQIFFAGPVVRRIFGLLFKNAK